ncbi:hypothetical protein [Streptomyces incarnatus]|uniref:hypothetical protein n=1 Tax=Streptomyces incarnatus TaxID=665007 RepID=UPI001AD80B49|nr:hypothetical protein [Streptomyces incarnatus]
MSDSTVEKNEPEVVPFMAYFWATVLTGGGAFSLTVLDNSGWHRYAHMLAFVSGLIGVGECVKKAREARHAGLPQPWLPPVLLAGYAVALVVLAVVVLVRHHSFP